MKKACKIEVKSTRRYLLGSAAEEAPVGFEEMWERFEGEVPEELDGYLPTDREGDALMTMPEPMPPSSSTLTAFGIFSKEKDGSFRISYEDSEITGMPGCLTTFCLTEAGPLILLRRGDVKTCMIFEEGRRHLCDYADGSAVPAMTLHTHALEGKVDENGGSFYVDYSVEIRGTLAERNEIAVTVSL